MSTTTPRVPTSPADPPGLRSAPSELARYADRHGHEHRIEVHHVPDGDAVVIDRSLSSGPCLLVGRFGADEPQAAVDALVSDYVDRAELGTLTLARRVRYEDLR